MKTTLFKGLAAGLCAVMLLPLLLLIPLNSFAGELPAVSILCRGEPVREMLDISGAVDGKITFYALFEPTFRDLTLQLDGGSRQVVEVFADAIQAEPRRAVEENWKVSLSADGAVTGPIA